VPKLPVSWDCPVLTTAPLVENAIKFAAVPKVGACAKFILGSDNNVKIVIVTSNIFALVMFVFSIFFFILQRSKPFEGYFLHLLLKNLHNSFTSCL
jgi:hypothetical protein